MSFEKLFQNLKVLLSEEKITFCFSFYNGSSFIVMSQVLHKMIITGKRIYFHFNYTKKVKSQGQKSFLIFLKQKDLVKEMDLHNFLLVKVKVQMKKIYISDQSEIFQCINVLLALFIVRSCQINIYISVKWFLHLV